MNQLFEEFMTAFKHESILGYEVTNNPNKRLTGMLRSDVVNTDFEVFLQDGVDSLIAIWNLSKNDRPIVYFNSEGSPFAVIAKNLEEFLSLLYLGTKPLIEIIKYTNYLESKEIHIQLGIDFTDKEPVGMSSKEIEKHGKKLRNEYENYDEVISWLEDHGIERPTSFHEQILNAYREMPNLQDFLNEKLGPA